MTQILLKIALYCLSVAIGFSVFALITHGLIAIGKVQSLDDTTVVTFTDDLLNGTTLFWLGGSLVGLFYFWIKGTSRHLFLVLPILMPLLFGIFYSITH